MTTHFFAVSMPGVLAKRYFIGTLIGQTLKVTRVQCSHPGDDLIEVNRKKAHILVLENGREASLQLM